MAFYSIIKMPPMKSAKRKAPPANEPEDTVATSSAMITQKPAPTAALDAALQILSHEKLCSLLKDIYSMDSAVEAHLSKMFLVSVHQVKSLGKGKDGEGSETLGMDSKAKDPLKAGPDEGETSHPGQEVLQPRFAICYNCSQTYDVTKNSKKSCRYHPGKYSALSFSRSSLITDTSPWKLANILIRHWEL